MILNAGDTATNTTINDGFQSVYSDGSATNPTINSGGTMHVLSGGVGTGIVQNSGGAIMADTSVALSGVATMLTATSVLRAAEPAIRCWRTAAT